MDEQDHAQQERTASLQSCITISRNSSGPASTLISRHLSTLFPGPIRLRLYIKASNSTFTSTMLLCCKTHHFPLLFLLGEIPRGRLTCRLKRIVKTRLTLRLKNSEWLDTCGKRSAPNKCTVMGWADAHSVSMKHGCPIQCHHRIKAK